MFPRIFARKDYANEANTFVQHPAMDPFPNFDLETLTACFDPIFPDSSSNKNLETHNPIILDSFNLATDPFAPPSTSCWAFLLPQHVGNGMCRHVHILFQTCNSDTWVDARIHMTDFYRILIGMEFHSSLSSFPVFTA